MYINESQTNIFNVYKRKLDNKLMYINENDKWDKRCMFVQQLDLIFSKYSGLRVIDVAFLFKKREFITTIYILNWKIQK